jgi:cytochrome c oxidase cbb3-type subunit IV
MALGVFRGLVTLVLMVSFLGLVIWAYRAGRDADFSEAARLPLGDDHAPPAHSGERRK